MLRSQRVEIEDGVFIDLFDAEKPRGLAALAEAEQPLDRLAAMNTFTPQAWYWQIKGDAGFVWSSARRARVAIDDKAFQEWLATGASLTYIGSIEEMREVWAKHGMIQDAGAQYRAARKVRYIAELRKPVADEEPSFENTVGDVFDIVIAQVEAMRQAAGAPATPDFAELIRRIQTIKAELPKGQDARTP